MHLMYTLDAQGNR
ncbi:hypothetical protein VHUM_00655 [Vanrija humicola]|uniref:Uncharacterized protein n=2 Tax=Dikarya TaxID=451864 RepID=A0A7D8Z1U3_VANHU|nr:hypothetical protein VHUM_00655 [Vanrija humicola]